MGSTAGKVMNHEQRLTLIESAGHGFWWARCKCGARTKVAARKVRSGNTRSCGCLNEELNRVGRKPKTTALPGSRYGKWTVGEDATRDKRGKRRVHVVCDCGFRSVVYAYSLEEKTSKSCITCSRSNRHHSKAASVSVGEAAHHV